MPVPPRSNVCVEVRFESDEAKEKLMRSDVNISPMRIQSALEITEATRKSVTIWAGPVVLRGKERQTYHEERHISPYRSAIGVENKIAAPH